MFLNFRYCVFSASGSKISKVFIANGLPPGQANGSGLKFEKNYAILNGMPEL